MNRQDTITIAKKKRFWRWMIFSIVVSVCLVGALFLPEAGLKVEIQNIHKIAVGGIATVILGLPFLISRTPTKKDLVNLAEQEMTELQCFSIPEFVKAQFGSIDLRDLSASSAFGIKHQGTINTTGGQLARMVGNNAGFGAGLEVAAIFGAISFLTKPKAKHVYEEILQKALGEVESYKQASSRSFLKLKVDLKESATQYIDSLPTRYSAVINEAFQHNEQLLGNRKKTLNELESYLTRLKKLDTQQQSVGQSRKDREETRQFATSLG